MRASTKGTPAWIALNSLGARLATAPMSSPPADRPSAAKRPSATQPDVRSQRAQAMKSVKVLRFLSRRPFSYHARPISPPPRGWAKATTAPRCRIEMYEALNTGSSETSYEP